MAVILDNNTVSRKRNYRFELSIIHHEEPLIDDTYSIDILLQTCGICNKNHGRSSATPYL